MIRLKYCSVAWTMEGCVTIFEDQTQVDSWAHYTPHYYVIANRCGYGDDVMSYCREHDLAHAFVEEKFHDRPSLVLWARAHGKVLSGHRAAYEEGMAQTFQRWVRANERPIIGGVQWDDLKDEFIALVGQA